jgi:hypothetical protein
MDSRQGLVLQQLLTIKNRLVTKCYTGPQVSSCEHGNEPLGYVKGVEFLAHLIDCCFSRRTQVHGVSYGWKNRVDFIRDDVA